MELIGLWVIALLTGYGVCMLTLQVWEWLSRDRTASR